MQLQRKSTTFVDFFLTEEAIKEGFKNLKPSEQYDNLYYAGFSRAIGDWLLGLNATRLYTVKYRRVQTGFIGW